MFNGQACTSPGPIKQRLHEWQGSSFLNVHRAHLVLGFCKATSAGPLGVGVHDITVKESHVSGHNHGNPYVGWHQTTFTLEAKEINLLDRNNGEAKVGPGISVFTSTAVPGQSSSSLLSYRKVIFTKMFSKSSIRIKWYDSLRCWDANGIACGWNILFNGEECTSPGPMKFVLYSSTGSHWSTSVGETLIGRCDNLKAGKHTITMVPFAVTGVTEGSRYVGLGVTAAVEIEEAGLAIDNHYGFEVDAIGSNELAMRKEALFTFNKVASGKSSISMSSILLPGYTSDDNPEQGVFHLRTSGGYRTFTYDQAVESCETHNLVWLRW
jgi:hypothetical protein